MSSDERRGSGTISGASGTAAACRSTSAQNASKSSGVRTFDRYSADPVMGRAPLSSRLALPLVLVADPVDRVHDLAVGQHGGDLAADLLDVAVDGGVGHPALAAVHPVPAVV